MKELFKDWKTIPNLLSFIRILLIPVFAVLYIKGYLLSSIIVLTLSGLSDFFDGKIARKFNQISDLGKLLDPVADKLTQITLAVVFFLSFNKSSDSLMKTYSWVFLLFIAKEIVMILISCVMLALNLRPKAAEIYGKAATFMFYLVMIVILIFGPDVGIMVKYFPNLALSPTITLILVAVSAVLTIVALVSYFPDTLRQFKNLKKKK